MSTCTHVYCTRPLNKLMSAHSIKSKIKINVAILKEKKRSNISKTGKVMTTKIGLHAFHVDLYLHEFFEPILFFEPHGL